MKNNEGELVLIQGKEIETVTKIWEAGKRKYHVTVIENSESIKDVNVINMKTWTGIKLK